MRMCALVHVGTSRAFVCCAVDGEKFVHGDREVHVSRVLTQSHWRRSKGAPTHPRIYFTTHTRAHQHTYTHTHTHTHTSIHTHTLARPCVHIARIFMRTAILAHFHVCSFSPLVSSLPPPPPPPPTPLLLLLNISWVRSTLRMI
jgi:hypothetical protein